MGIYLSNSSITLNVTPGLFAEKDLLWRPTPIASLRTSHADPRIQEAISQFSIQDKLRLKKFLISRKN